MLTFASRFLAKTKSVHLTTSKYAFCTSIPFPTEGSIFSSVNSLTTPVTQSTYIQKKKASKPHEPFILVFTPHPTNMQLDNAEEEINTHVKYIQEVLKSANVHGKFLPIRDWSGFDYDRGNYTWRHSLKKYAKSSTIPYLIAELENHKISSDIVDRLKDVQKYFDRVNEARKMPYEQAVQMLVKAWKSANLNKIHQEIELKLEEADPTNRFSTLFQNIGFTFPSHQLRISSSYLDGRNPEGEEKLNKLMKIFSKLKYERGISDIIIAEYQDDTHLQSLFKKFKEADFDITNINIIPLLEKGDLLQPHEEKSEYLKKTYQGYNGDMYAGSDTMKSDGPGKTVSNMCRMALAAAKNDHDFVFYGLGTTPFRSNGANLFYVRDLFSIVKTLLAPASKPVSIMATIQGGHLHDLLQHSDEFLNRIQNTWDKVVPLTFTNDQMLDFFQEFEEISEILYDSYTTVFKDSESFISMLRKEDGTATLLGVMMGYSGTGSRQKQNLEIKDSKIYWKSNDLRAIDFQYLFRLLGVGSGFADLALMTSVTKKKIENSLKRGNPITKLYAYLIQCGVVELNPDYMEFYDELKTHPTILEIERGIENWQSLKLEGLPKVDANHLYNAGYYSRIPNHDERKKALINLVDCARKMRVANLNEDTIPLFEMLIKAGHFRFVASQSVGSKSGVKS
jgi:hypothetical protein